ncbi:hypothetical protein [Paraburkholderia dilworthii]|uniref:Uncharacterized protein n=1 Tax=Paraburkholderia dilworthii TaxID=948106 RepID=A0ABW9D519_9BURK
MTTTHTTAERYARTTAFPGRAVGFFVAQMLDGSGRTWFIEDVSSAIALNVQLRADARGHDREALRTQNLEGFFSFTAGGFAMTTTMKPKKIKSRKDATFALRLSSRLLDEFNTATEARDTRAVDVLRFFIASYVKDPTICPLGLPEHNSSAA